MDLPRIGDTVTTQQALALCAHFELDYLVRRINAHFDQYDSWKFDGCSGVPDEMLGLFTGCRWEDITFKCCLPHDLCYAYGEPGNDIERQRVDLNFYNDLVSKAGMRKFLASAFLEAVRIGGKEEFGLSFSWAFARKKCPLNGIEVQPGLTGL
ncbi:MAG: hypothetical protein C4519_18595 [Desulfobacteraceae bacterium]|nr:MAG: hypothetical protein C4519_18595 [Desulfobacteraceae bacterium]